MEKKKGRGRKGKEREGAIAKRIEGKMGNRRESRETRKGERE